MDEGLVVVSNCGPASRHVKHSIPSILLASATMLVSRLNFSSVISYQSIERSGKMHSDDFGNPK